MFVIDTALRFSQCPHMITHDEIRDELIKRLTAREVTGKGIADILGIAPARITEIKNGKRQIQQDEMVKLAKLFGLGEIEATAAEPSVVWVPVIGIASAGNWREAVAIPTYSVPLPYAPGLSRCFAVEVQGDSMDKVMVAGSNAIINPDDKRLYDGRVYLISNHEFDATIKRYRTNPARFDPDSHNPEHEPIYADEHQISVIGRVIYFTGKEGL